MDYLMLAFVLAGVAYMIAVANYGAPSPLSVVRRLVRAADMSTENPSSEPVHDDAADSADMSGPWDPGGILMVSREHAAQHWGVRPDLQYLGGDDDGPGGEDATEAPASADRAARQEWVRARIADGWPGGRINRTGARRFGVDEKTIRRDRVAIERGGAGE